MKSSPVVVLVVACVLVCAGCGSSTRSSSVDAGLVGGARHLGGVTTHAAVQVAAAHGTTLRARDARERRSAVKAASGTHRPGEVPGARVPRQMTDAAKSARARATAAQAHARVVVEAALASDPAGCLAKKGVYAPKVWQGHHHSMSAEDRRAVLQCLKRSISAAKLLLASARPKGSG